MKNSNIKKIEESLLNSFFGIWVKKYKFSFFLIFLILVLSAVGLYQIPKESSPKIKYGIFMISTEYRGASIEGVDYQVTKKIEKNVQYIKGVKTVYSSSFAGTSNVTIELEGKVDSVAFKSQLEEKLNNIEFTSGVKKPKIFELSEDTQLMYKLLIYADKDKLSYSDLVDKGTFLQDKIEKLYGVSSAKIQNYEGKNVNIYINRSKIESLGLDIFTLSNAINSNLKDFGLGTHKIEDNYYSYNLKGGTTDLEYIKDLTIKGENGSRVKLSDISEIKIELKNKDTQRYAGTYNNDKNYGLGLIINKIDGTSIFDVSKKVKAEVENIFENNKDFQGVDYVYAYDLYEYLEEDYSTLQSNAIQTIVIVLIVIGVLISFKEGLIAAFTIPLSFGLAILILERLGYSLNMLTNFSLVLSFGIAIDTGIVIVEGAYEKLKRGYSSKHAIILSVREFAPSLISGTLTTIVVFLPIMFLPGVIGKFLSFIPITIILALLCALILDLSLTSAIFYRANKDKKTFIRDNEEEKFLNEEEKILLESDRIGKSEIFYDEISKKDKISQKIHNWYAATMYKIIDSKLLRNLFLYVPIIVLVLNFIFIAPLLKFNLFPKSDQGFIIMQITGDSSIINKKLDFIDTEISKIDELKAYTMSVKSGYLEAEIELLALSIRKDRGLLKSYDLEKKLKEKFDFIKQEGLGVSIKQSDGGDGGENPISIKLIMDENGNYNELLKVGENISKEISNVDGIKYVSSGNDGSYKEIEMYINKDKAQVLGVDINSLGSILYSSINGEKAGIIDMNGPKDLIIKYDNFKDEVIPTDVLQTQIKNADNENISVGNIIDISLSKGYNKIARLDGEITIFIEADVSKGSDIPKIQKQVDEIAENYNYPNGISYKSWGELEENKDLIDSLALSFVLAILLIFGILTWQFNSYIQPFMIVYSIFLTLIGINVGFIIHGLDYSIAFAIGMIAMAGIVVNDDIIFIDKINRNIEKSGNFLTAVVEGAKSRLQPVFITTITTVAGVLPLASKDAFWASISYTIVYGLIIGSLCTLFVTPVLYWKLFKKNSSAKK